MVEPSTRTTNPVKPGIAAARVLVVDDIEANRDLLVRRLRRLGITQVLQAADGRAALAIMADAPLDLVLLDIMMPVMTGFDVLEEMAAAGRIAGLPVIVISATNEMESIVRAIELGAEDFLLKPFDPTLLRARVLATLEKKQLRDAMREALAQKQAELDEARSLQLALVPPPYTSATLSIDIALEPAREVGGDLVDHAALPDGRRLLVLGDVSDKGAGAALTMARTHALIRGHLPRLDDPAAAVQAINTELAAHNPSCTFVTLLLAIFDPATGALAYCRCGHVPPFLRRANGTVERLATASGMALGVTDLATYTTAHATLAPGDALLILSDGVTEAATADGALLGDAAVAAWLADSPAGLASLITAVRTHEAGGPPSDDLAALLLHYHQAQP